MTKMGPPSKYRESYCDLLVDWMSEGKSYNSFILHLYKEEGVRITARTLYEWEKHYTNWVQAKEMGFEMRTAWWEATLQGQADGSVKGNAAAAIFALKNYWPKDYKDKREVEHTAHVPVLINTGVPDSLPDVNSTARLVDTPQIEMENGDTIETGVPDSDLL